MNSGTFNVSRSIWKHDAFAPEPLSEREAFMWIVSEAAWKPRVRRVGKYVVNLERGQLAASVRFMAEEWRWSKSRVSRFLLRLKNRDMVQTESGTGVLAITVCNYEEYQNAPRESGTEAGQSAGQKRDSSGTTQNKDARKGRKKETRDAPISASSFPSIIRPEVAERWLEFRKAKRAPVTPGVMRLLSQALTELHTEGIDANDALDTAIARGWQGFKADWIRNDLKNHPQQPTRTNGNDEFSELMRIADDTDRRAEADSEVDDGAGLQRDVPLLARRHAS